MAKKEEEDDELHAQSAEGAEAPPERKPRKRSKRKTTNTNSAAGKSGRKLRNDSKQRGDGDKWLRRNNDEFKRQQPVQARRDEGERLKDAKRKGDQHAGIEARVREGRLQQGQERERQRDYWRGQQGRWSELGQRGQQGIPNSVRGYAAATQQRGEAARNEGKRAGQGEQRRTGSVLNTHNAGVYLNKRH